MTYAEVLQAIDERKNFRTVVPRAALATLHALVEDKGGQLWEFGGPDDTMRIEVSWRGA